MNRTRIGFGDKKQPRKKGSKPVKKNYANTESGAKAYAKACKKWADTNSAKSESSQKKRAYIEVGDQLLKGKIDPKRVVFEDQRQKGFAGKTTRITL